jgi:hypothetical protein
MMLDHIKRVDTKRVTKADGVKHMPTKSREYGHPERILVNCRGPRLS